MVREIEPPSCTGLSKRVLQRLGAGALAMVLAVTAGGCSVIESWLVAVRQGNEPAASPCVDVWPTDQASPSTQRQLVDAANGFELALPANWRRLAPRDAGWATIYGGHDSTTEQQVADGVIQDFAVPLEPRDCDLVVNLAVYVLAASTSVTLEQAADAYERTLTSVADPARPIGRDVVTLPAGPAERITAIRPHTFGAAGFDDRLVVYILSSDAHIYYLVFVSSDASADRYAAVYLGIARSFEYTRPGT